MQCRCVLSFERCFGAARLTLGVDGDRLDGGLCWILCMQDALYVYHRLLDSRILCEIGVLCVGLLIVQITILRLSTALIKWGDIGYSVLHQMNSMVMDLLVAMHKLPICICITEEESECEEFPRSMIQLNTNVSVVLASLPDMIQLNTVIYVFIIPYRDVQLQLYLMPIMLNGSNRCLAIFPTCPTSRIPLVQNKMTKDEKFFPPCPTLTLITPSGRMRPTGPSRQDSGNGGSATGKLGWILAIEKGRGVDCGGLEGLMSVSC